MRKWENLNNVSFIKNKSAPFALFHVGMCVCIYL